MAGTGSRSEALGGLLLGTAVGDALGLPLEGLSPQRAARLFPGPPRQRLLPGWGLVSDDTDHALFAAQALLAHPHDIEGFRLALSWKLRFWLLGLPAGIGFASLRAILRMWLGFARPGVFSAGNGPAMRSPVLGAALAEDPVRLAAYVRASTELTHTDPRALTGAMALAVLAAHAVREARPPSPPELEALLRPLGADGEWPGLVGAIASQLERGESVAAFAAALGLQRGVTGYMYHSVPVAIYAWARHEGDFERAMAETLALGGDADSVGAMVGALAGTTGEIPAGWQRIFDWPRGPGFCLEVAQRLATGGPPVRYFWPGLVLRNALLLVTVLLHAAGRIRP